MGLSRRKGIAIAADESTFGVDALDGLSTSQLAALAIPVIDPNPNTEVTLRERRVVSGTKGNRPQSVGRGSATFTFGMELTASANPLTQVNQWMENMQAAGCREVVGACLTLNKDEDVSPVGSEEAAQTQPGEAMFGPMQLTGTSAWRTGEFPSGGSTTTTPAPTFSSPMNVVCYPENGSPTDEEAVTGVAYNVFDDTTDDFIVVKLDADIDRYPGDGWHIRVDTTGGGAYVYQQLQADTPVFVVAYQENFGSVAAAVNCYGYIKQGTFNATADILNITGQKSGIACNVGTIAFNAKVIEPDSEQQITFTTDSWSSDEPDPADPTLNEIVRKDDPTYVASGALVQAWDGTTVTITDYWGSWPAAARVELSTGSFATIQTAAVQTRTPSRTYWSIEDGRKIPFVGCRNQVSISCQAGDPAEIEFEARGTLGANPTMIQPPTVKIPIQLPPQWAGGYCNINGFLLKAESFEFALQNTLTDVPDANAPNGVAGVQLTGRDPQVTFTVETAGTLAGAGNWEQIMREGTWVTAAVAMISGSRRIAIVWPRLQVESAAPSGDEILQHRITCRCRETTGDDDFYIVVF